MGDADLGKMYLNYQLDERLKPYAGVDCTLSQKALWEEELEMERQQKVPNLDRIKILIKCLKKEEGD